MGAQLVILAAGMGRRFGGLKQLTPVGPGGAAIMDYTVHDALQTGFDEIVLVIRREIEDEVRAHVEAGFGRRIGVRFVHQELPVAPAARTRPWGTGQAVLCAAPVLRGPFAVANADDFYGRVSLEAVGSFLAEEKTDPPTWAMVGYRVADTLPTTGAVSRGLIREEGGWLRRIEEVHSVRRHPDGACWGPDDEVRILPADSLVSMNLWGFGVEVLGQLEDGFNRFLASSPGPEAEFYLPVGVGEVVAASGARVRVLPTSGSWCGITAAGDLEVVERFLAAKVGNESYPARLWI